MAGLGGNIGVAGTALFKAIAVAEKLGDTTGAINFTIWLANGMAVNGMADGALKQLDKADQLAKQSGYEKVPFLLSIAKLRAIANLPESERMKRMDEARNLFEATFQIAKEERVAGAEVELLNQDGQLELAAANTAQAERAFLQAAAIAESAELSGLSAEGLLLLARIYLQTNQLPKASLAIERGLKSLRKDREGYDLPLFVATPADIAAALGRLTTADALYERIGCRPICLTRSQSPP